MNNKGRDLQKEDSIYRNAISQEKNYF